MHGDRDRRETGGLLLRPAVLSSGAAARTGRTAEEAVADYLEAQGFRVEARNARVGRLEIDVVARKGGLVVVVEVRSRREGGYETALGSVCPAKRRRLLEATRRLWREQLRDDPSVDRVRIDVAAVTFEGATTRVEYVEGAVVDGG